MATKTYSELQAQIASLQRQAEEVRKKEVAGVIARIKEAIEHYGLTSADLGLVAKPKQARRGSVPQSAAGKPAQKTGAAVKFRDEQGNTWSGRGPRPAWFKAALQAGKSPSDLLA